MISDEILIKGITHWQKISDAQNKYILTLGNIPPGHNLYIKYLNRWDNDDWIAIVIAMEEVLEVNPELFIPYQIDTIEKVKALIRANKDIKTDKRLQWKMIMVMREVWNSLNNTDIERLDVYTKKG